MNQCTGKLILNQYRNVENVINIKCTLEQIQRFLIMFHLFRVKFTDSTTGLKIEKVGGKTRVAQTLVRKITDSKSY